MSIIRKFPYAQCTPLTHILCQKMSDLSSSIHHSPPPPLTAVRSQSVDFTPLQIPPGADPHSITVQNPIHRSPHFIPDPHSNGFSGQQGIRPPPPGHPGTISTIFLPHTQIFIQYYWSPTLYTIPCTYVYNRYICVCIRKHTSQRISSTIIQCIHKFLATQVHLLSFYHTHKFLYHWNHALQLSICLLFHMYSTTHRLM